MPHHSGDDKLDQVLQLLIEAAQENKVGFNQYVAKLFDKLKRSEASAEKKVRETAVVVDNHIHNQPWIYIGAAALSGLVVGYLLPRPKSRP